MPLYTVSVVIEGVDLTDEVIDSLFQEVEDAVPSSVDGAMKVTASVDAPDDLSAALALVDQVLAVLPDAVLARVDQDLVSITDIADRTNRTRESIRLLVEGKRGPGRFPTPVGTVGDGIRVWPWTSVLSWFHDALGQDLGEHGVSSQTAALVDAYLSGRIRRPAGDTRYVAAPHGRSRPLHEGTKRSAAEADRPKRATA